jgi:MucB/RseB N-terminal domain
MRKRTLSENARVLAGVFLLLATPFSARAAERLTIAGERKDGGCPVGPPLGIVQITSRQELPASLERCVVLFEIGDLADSSVLRDAARLAKTAGAATVVLDFTRFSQTSDESVRARLPFAIKQLSSAVRAASPKARIGLDFSRGPGEPFSLDLEEGLGAYFDAIAAFAGRTPPAFSEEGKERWLFLLRTPGRSAAGEVVQAVLAAPAVPQIVGVFSTPERAVDDSDWQEIGRLQRYWTDDVSRDPTATTATRPDGSRFTVLRFFDAKKFTPILVLAEDPSGRVSIELAGGTYAKASVENLSSGAKRDFELHGAKTFELDLSRGPLAVVLEPAKRPDERTRVEVGAARGLTADEIIAHERAWDAGQREKVSTFIAEMEASLRFRVAEVNETFDLTIRGPFFFRRGEPADWGWREFYLNGVKWKGKTLPKIPILQPEKVTTLPLDIRLTEDYRYELAGTTEIAGRRAYEITFTPKENLGNKPVYRGKVWIDAQTFALLRRDSVQLNLKGETLSNVQTEIYHPVPGHPDVALPLEIRGQQVFSTAGRTTAIERDVKMKEIEINPANFPERRAAAYRSDLQMIRDTDLGMRYLVPDREKPGERVVEEKISKKSTFGIAGGFYDDSLSYPIPLLGIQHFNFDLWGKGKQLSVFFGGALLTANYTDPSFLGGRFDLGADLFAVAFPFGDVAYRNGKEVPDEKVKHLPAIFQVNVGRPLGPFLKASLGIFTRWDNFQRDPDTGPRFVMPVDTFTDGAELRMVGNYRGFNATAIGGFYRRREWQPWGNPDTSDFDPRDRDYYKYQLSLSKDQYFPGFRKLHVSLTYLDGQDLDRFSKYEFGAFSGNPLHGFKSGSVKTQTALLGSVSYGLNIEDIIRFEAIFDQAVVRDRQSGYDNTYFAGAGLLGSLNGPWQNSLLRFEVGVPVVSHGVKGFVVNLILLKLF